MCVFPSGTVVPATYTTQATVPSGKGYFQLVSGGGADGTGSGVGAEAPKSLVSIFTSAIKSAVTSAPSAAVVGALGELECKNIDYIVSS